jgi:hypothetical protein
MIYNLLLKSTRKDLATYIVLVNDTFDVIVFYFLKMGSFCMSLKKAVKNSVLRIAENEKISCKEIEFRYSV